MKTTQIIISLLLLAVSGFIYPQRICAQESNPIIINDSDWPPYFFAGDPEQPKGFGKELLELCLPETDYQYEFKFYPIKRMWTYIEEGKLDINIFSYNKEREELLVYGREPLFLSGYRPVVLAGKDIQIQEIADFDQLTLGHFAGLKYSPEFLNYVEQREKDGTLVVANSNEAMLELLLKGRIDVFVNTSDTILWVAKQKGALDKIKVLDYDIKTGQYFVTISKKSTTIKDKQAFLATMDQCLKQVKADGRYKEITKKYGIE